MTVDGIRTSLRNAGVDIIQVSPRAYAVEDRDLAAFLAARPAGYKRGRPRGSKNKPKKNKPKE